MSDESYAALQAHLLLHPGAGALIRGSGGLRKLRWELPGRGKRGGARVIYYWGVRRAVMLMLAIYAKNEAEDLTQAQIRMLGEVVRKEFHDE